VTYYNTQRPHQSLGDLTPQSRFHSADGEVRQQLRQPERNGEQWVSRRVARNGVVCVDSQHISVGKHFGGSTCDVLVTPGLFQFWVGDELLKTVARAKPGEVRKKHAEAQLRGDKFQVGVRQINRSTFRTELPEVNTGTNSMHQFDVQVRLTCSRPSADALHLLRYLGDTPQADRDCHRKRGVLRMR
jgi:hypothetical protein